MDVRLKSETPTTVTFEWDRVPGARGFRFTHPNGKISHTWDGARTEAKFSKTNGVYLIEPLQIPEVGEGEYPPVTEPPQQMGAALRAAYPPPTGLQVVDFGGQTLTSPYVLDGATKGGKHLRNVKSVGANPDGFKFAGGAHDIILERFLIDLATSQGVNLQRAPRRIRFISGVIRNIGTGDKFDHCGYIGSGSSEILFAGVLMFGASGEGIQWYPGPSEGLMTHCTMGRGSGSQEELCVWGGEDDGGDPTGPSVVTVWNSIIDGDIQMAGTDKTLRLRGTCCVTGNIPSSVDTTGCTLIRESPGFDGQHKPTNPKLLASGDPGWTPALDAYGNQYARPTVGAVAA